MGPIKFDDQSMYSPKVYENLQTLKTIMQHDSSNPSDRRFSSQVPESKKTESKREVKMECEDLNESQAMEDSVNLNKYAFKENVDTSNGRTNASTFGIR